MTLSSEDGREEEESGKTELMAELLDATRQGSQPKGEANSYPTAVAGGQKSLFISWVLLSQDEHHWSQKMLWAFLKVLSIKSDDQRLSGRHGWESTSIWGNNSFILKGDQPVLWFSALRASLDWGFKDNCDELHL